MADSPDDTKHDTEKFGTAESSNPNVIDANRKCRDVLCLLLFIIMWILWIILAIMAFSDGCPSQCNDPWKLVYGYDSSGCRCGKDCTGSGGPDNSNKLRLYIPDPRTPTVRLCLTACPASFDFDKDSAVSSGVYLCPGNLCSNCPSGLPAGSKCFYNERQVPSVLGAAAVQQAGASDDCFLPFANASDCWYPTYATSDIFYKCVPSLPANLSSAQLAGFPFSASTFSSTTSVLSNPAGDIGKMAAELISVWKILIIAVALAIAMGFVYLILLRLFARCCVLVTVFGLLIALFICTIFSWDMTGKVPIFASVSKATGVNVTSPIAGSSAVAESQSQPALCYAVAVVLTILTVVYVVILCIMLKRLMIAVAIIQEAAKSLAAMPFLLLLPVTTFLSLLLLYIWAGFIAIYLLSAGQFDPATGKFVFANGDCSTSVMNINQNITALTAIVTLSLTGLDGPQLVIQHSALQGTGCSYSSSQLTNLCTGNAATLSNPRLPIAGCLGYSGGLGANCTQSKALKNYYFANSLRTGDFGTAAWDASAGSITLNLAAGVPSWPAGTLRFGLDIYRTGGQTWSLSGAFAQSSAATSASTWTLQTANVTSKMPPLSNAVASRFCNLNGGTSGAVAAAVAQQTLAIAQQSLADANEVSNPGGFLAGISLTNWKSALPVTLDGTTYNYFVIYHLFMFLWTNTFIVSSGFFVTCGAVAGWYWAEDKKDLGKSPILASTWRYARYNLGTVLVGSFIIAVVQLIRILFNYYVNQCKKFKDNALVKVMVCLVNCCLWCLEKVIGFINKNAYIMAATHGHGFCTAAFKGFCLIMRNLLRVAAVHVVAGMVFLFGKLFILAATMAICYIILQSMKTSMNLANSVPFLALVMVGILAWFVGCAFIAVFESAVDTIFLSFLHDSEANNGADKKYRMAESLMDTIGVHNEVKPNAVAPEK